MAFSYNDILQSEAERIDQEASAAVAELEAGRLAEDISRVQWAFREILKLDAERNALVTRATNYARPPQAAPLAGAEDMSHRDLALARQFGLSAHELGAAKNWTSDPNLSDEARVKTYVENRQRYRQARSDGSYRDDQGTVRR
jgi:hypothetical protein